jgi:Ni,Fe-hydrogenase I cytochrome b subunit
MKQPTFWEQIQQYLFIKKKPSDRPNGTNLKLMHGMNRISIIMFLIAVVIMVYRLLVKR